MKLMNKIINNKWFFEKPHFIFSLFHIYINGDALIVLPIFLIIIATLIVSPTIALLELGIFLFLRGFGEMIYWLLHQFGDRKYRPDTIFKKLDNNAIYIIYQLTGLFNAFIGALIVILTFKFLL